MKRQRHHNSVGQMEGYTWCWFTNGNFCLWLIGGFYPEKWRPLPVFW